MRFIHKFTLLLSILVIIGSLIQFFSFEMIFLKNTNSLFLNINSKAANNINDRLSVYFGQIEDSLKIIAFNPNVWMNRELLAEVCAKRPELDDILVLDKHGNIVLSSQNRAASAIKLETQDYFQHAIQGETYITPVVANLEEHRVIAIATPIIQNEVIEGVVVGTISLNRNALASLFNNKPFARDAYIVVADNQGTMLFHPDKNLIGSPITAIEKMQGASGATILSNGDGQEQYVSYKRNSKTGYLTIVYSLVSEIKQLRNIIIYQNLSISIVTVFLIIFFGTYTIRRYMAPFEDLTKAFGSIREGQYAEIAPSHHAAEFDEIIHAYNRTVMELEAVHNKLLGEANNDGLTAALNRRAFVHTKESLDSGIQSRSINTLGIILIDFDDFKNINDTQGHLAGDDILKEFVDIAKAIIAPHPLFRYGGDEFIAVLRNVPRDTVVRFAEQIRQSCEQKLHGSTISIGIATYPENANSLDELLVLADQTLYTSKMTKNKVTEHPTVFAPKND